MNVTHGNAAARKPIHAPQSRSFSGPFGRLFRELPPWEPDGNNEAQKIATIGTLAAEMAEAKAPKGYHHDNPKIPSGYTFLAQFVDHDLTFDPRSSLQKQNDPDNLDDFRSPAFDLDCVYGRGPDDQPYLYNKDMSLRIGDNKPTGTDDDLPRYGGTALIGDKRNDENTIVSQLQLAFLKFHNAVLAGPAKRDFQEAQRIVRWHYQWVVIHDLLKRLCGEKLVDHILEGGDCPGKPKLCYYSYRDFPFMPVEFSVAAYRLGHSMIRARYRLNEKVDVPLFTKEDNEEAGADLRGFMPLPRGFTIEWSYFFDFTGQKGVDPKQTQPSNKLDRFLAAPLLAMPTPIANPADVGLPNPNPPPPESPISRSLAMRNLLRSWRLQLPSGQAVARLMGVTKTKVPKHPELPLWRYILEEAQRDMGGERLGEVGARIVAETFIGLLHADPSSYYRNAPRWEPELDAIKDGFQMRDIIKFAGAPIA